MSHIATKRSATLGNRGSIRRTRAFRSIAASSAVLLAAGLLAIAPTTSATTPTTSAAVPGAHVVEAAPSAAATVAATTPLALPDMRVLVPTNAISIGVDSTSGQRQLRFTHITEDAGTGPFEIDPRYDPGTGTAVFTQVLYSMPSPGVWRVNHVDWLAAAGTFSPPSDYIFGLTAFTLNAVNANGSVGRVLKTSPKTDYCITGDTQVGGVANTPNQSFIPVDDCTDPTKPLGWSVGWGDEYDQTDAGQPIDLTGVADGTYILRGVVDPRHVLLESSANNDVTDTKLQISGNSVTVMAQTTPNVVPPAVRLTAPGTGAVTGRVTLAASATATGATVSKVQFLLDGRPLGAAVTRAPYQLSWTIGSTTVGLHTLSAQATDSNGNIATAKPVLITVRPAATATMSVDQLLTKTGNGGQTAGPFSTTAAGERVLALVGTDGPATPGGQRVTVHGAGLRWIRLSGSNGQFGDSEIWGATAPAKLVGVHVAVAPSAGGYDESLTVLSLKGSAGWGATAGASGPTGAPIVTLTSKRAGSLSYAVGTDYDNPTAHVAGHGQQIISQFDDASAGDSFWSQTTISPSPGAGRTITLNDTSPTTDRWDLAAAEVLAAGAGAVPADLTAPTAAIINPTPEQIVSGDHLLASNAFDNVAVGSVQFLLDGKPLGARLTQAPYAIHWNTATASNGHHVLSARVMDLAGNVGTASLTPVTVQNPAPPMTCFVLQAQRSAHGTGTVTTRQLNTAVPGEQLVAMVNAGGPNSPGSQTVAVSGGGLRWRLVRRANTEPGDSEIWIANAPAAATSVAVTATALVPGYDVDLTVVAMDGAAGAGATAAAGGVGGTASATVTTTDPASLVLAVGRDGTAAVGREMPLGDVFLHQTVDSTAGATSWSEYTNQNVTAAGTVVAIGAGARRTGKWNLVAMELLGDGE